MKSFQEYYEGRVNESKSFVDRSKALIDKVDRVIDRVDRYGGEALNKTYGVRCPIHCEKLKKEDDGLVCHTCNKVYSRIEGMEAYFKCMFKK